jgi:hypothetical protein
LFLFEVIDMLTEIGTSTAKQATSAMSMLLGPDTQGIGTTLVFLKSAIRRFCPRRR